MGNKEKRAKLIAEMREINDKLLAEKRDFTAEERASYDAKDAEVKELTAKIEAEERNAELAGFSSELPIQNTSANAENRTGADIFAATGKTEMRAVLASGNIAKPSKASSEVNGLAAIADSIVDDVNAIALSGAGSWIAAYKASDSVAAATTDGSQVGGTGGSASTPSSFNYVTISPAEWGVLDEISKQVKKMSPADYDSAVKDSALIALRYVASQKIITAVTGSALKKSTTYALDEKFVRSCALGFRAIPGKGSVKLYLTQNDLITLGDVRGTHEKKPVYEISYGDDTNTWGTIKDGALAVTFRILDGLSDGTQLFGQPKSIDMPMWDNYQIETDEGGDYFKRNVMGIRGIQTANAGLAAKYGMCVNTSTQPTT